MGNPVAPAPAAQPAVAASERGEKLFKAAPTERLVSLDAFRGFTMFWIVGGAALFRTVQYLCHNMAIDLIERELHHTPWIGLGYYDCIWPSFMLMVGVSIPLAMAKRSLTQSYNQQLRHAIQRAVVLFLLGSVRQSVALHSPYLIELSSALQPIAIAYLVAFLVAKRSWRFQAWLAGIILAAWACVLAFVPAPGIPAGTYGFNHSLVHYVDMALLGPEYHLSVMLTQGWGTVICTIPVVSTTLFGLLIGELLLSGRSKAEKAKLIGGMGVLFLVVGFGLSPAIPIVMKIWTTTYGLVSAGVACLLFLFFFWLVDMARYRKWTVIFTPFGMNAIFIYMAVTLISFRAGTEIFTEPIARHLGRGGPLFNALGTIGVEWVVLFWMMKRRVLIKA